MSLNTHQFIDSAPPTAKPVRFTKYFGAGSQGPSNGRTPARAMKPKRQRIRPSSRDQKPKKQTFYFVDSNNTSSSEKRAHVMRHHIEKKRKQQQDWITSVNGDRDGDKDHWWRKDSGFEANSTTRAPGGNESQSASTTKYGYDDIIAQPETALSRRIAVGSHLPSPATILDASRKDPFRSLPMMCTQDDLELADYWVNRLSYWSGQNQHLKNETFRAAMDHPLAFQAVILAYCARWRSQIYGLKDSKEFNHHMDQVNKGIENVGKGSMQIGEDSLVLTYSGLALQEERFGSQGAAEIYVDRAARALRPRTAGKATAEVLLHYVRYMITRPCPTIDPGRRQWLVPFLRRAEELMWEHRTEAFLSMVPERRDAFQMGSPLFPLLSSGPHPSRVPEAKRMYVLQDAPTQYVSRGAALIYITAALWEFRDSPSKTRRFLTHLFALANEHRLDRDPACETFVWLLLEETCSMDLRSRERAWSTGELLNISKELPSGLQFRFNEILMGFLQWMIPIPGLDVFEGEVQKA